LKLRGVIEECRLNMPFDFFKYFVRLVAGNENHDPDILTNEVQTI
jgi:hypothetical protein